MNYNSQSAAGPTRTFACFWLDELAQDRPTSTPVVAKSARFSRVIVWGRGKVWKFDAADLVLEFSEGGSCGEVGVLIISNLLSGPVDVDTGGRESWVPGTPSASRQGSSLEPRLGSWASDFLRGGWCLEAALFY